MYCSLTLDLGYRYSEYSYVIGLYKRTYIQTSVFFHFLRNKAVGSRTCQPRRGASPDVPMFQKMCLSKMKKLGLLGGVPVVPPWMRQCKVHLVDPQMAMIPNSGRSRISRGGANLIVFCKICMSKRRNQDP